MYKNSLSNYQKTDTYLNKERKYSHPQIGKSNKKMPSNQNNTIINKIIKINAHKKIFSSIAVKNESKLHAVSQRMLFSYLLKREFLIEVKD